MTTAVLHTKVSEVEYEIRITSNKTKHLEIQNKLNSLRTKDYNFY